MLKALEVASSSKNNNKSSPLAVYVSFMRFQVKVDSFELFDELMNYKTVPSEYTRIIYHTKWLSVYQHAK